MKKHLSFLSALFVAAAIFLAPGASTVFAKGGPPAARGRDRDHGDHDRDNRGRHDNGRHRGHYKQWNRDNDGRYRFDNDDRQRVDVYYRNHRGYFRDRWHGEGPPIGYGYVIEPTYRRYCRPVPSALMVELAPPPPGLRYYVLGGNVVLVDDGYRVQDYIHIGVNIGL